ncbi:m7GpppX diphosphatase [Grifola frondosa]|uniref:M7GpppX diphosphatase n=1 Tax=Grifola frondosa TaxID=5627 RepID=A0A1C7MKH3_GRIFR|nr:m7GpppX diphosphatase [Grifola frondosa]
MRGLVISNLDTLRRFRFERVLNEDPISHTITLLGSFPDSSVPEKYSAAIVRIEKTAFSVDSAQELFSTWLQNAKLIESTDIYTWLFGWGSNSGERPDVKINIVYPATEVHIRKYSKQEVVMVHETPELVDNILTGKSEADKVLHKDPSPDFGYVMLPDMKWDLTTISSLYAEEYPREATRKVKGRWGLEEGSLRMFVHYQPSYYHFHVHIVNANYQGLHGMSVGQAHLLDDVISLLECDPDDGPSVFQRMTFTYGLGEQHSLFEPMKAAQAALGYH